MKNKALLLMAAVGLVAASCSSADTEDTNEEVEEVQYTLDVENSTLKWHGEENAEHYHDGTMSFKDGNMTMKGEEVVSGTYTIELSSIQAMTEGYPQEKMDYLKSHFMDTSFFFADMYPEIKITTGEFKDGKLSTTINVRGVDIDANIPVSIDQTEDGASVSGKFSIDFADAQIPYVTEPDPETGVPGAKSAFDFEMDLKFKK